MPNFKLTYFDARAKGEPARMLFHLVGQKYEDIRYDYVGEEWPKIKGDRKSKDYATFLITYKYHSSKAYVHIKYAPGYTVTTTKATKGFPLGQLPVLDVDGELLTQSRAIYRYIARQFPGDYYGKNNLECARIDEILGIVADIEVVVEPAYETPDAAKREADLVKCRDSTLKPSWDFFSESLQKAGGKYFMGNRITIADVVIFNIIDFFLDTIFGLKTYFESYPTLLKFYESIKNDSPLTQYLKDRKKTKY
ncbi:glutathione S-transferase 1 [Strongylocentrotus purpuratus]|uniref:Glutathione S-transferase n=1 Tax=Strongylocentrotus purpuratus TaxID=7668 RepID=A0A7M7NDC3_STRPU|nr:glutathione S-transferase 1 [Strongylocentrotus purpuratus]